VSEARPRIRFFHVNNIFYPNRLLSIVESLRSKEITLIVEAEQDRTRQKRAPGDLRNLVGGQFGDAGKKLVGQKVGSDDLSTIE
jgi:hypothetical protein